MVGLVIPEDEQKYAEMFIKDVQLGNIMPESGKSFRDYITEYVRRAKDDQIHRFATTFGLNEGMLREIMELHVAEDTINEFARFDKLKATADITRVRAYVESVSGESLSVFIARSRFYTILWEFSLSGGFEI